MLHNYVTITFEDYLPLLLMNCKTFLKLDDFEQALFLASLLHICSSDEEFFKKGTELIADGKKKGLLDRVKFSGSIYQESEKDSGHDQNHLNELT